MMVRNRKPNPIHTRENTVSQTQVDSSLRTLKDSIVATDAQTATFLLGLLFVGLGWEKAACCALSASLLCLLRLIYITWVRDRRSSS